MDMVNNLFLRKIQELDGSLVDINWWQEDSAIFIKGGVKFEEFLNEAKLISYPLKYYS